MLLNSSSKTVVSLIAGFAVCVLAWNGPAYSIEPVNSANFIRSATVTLVIPSSPNPIVENTVLWTGMGISNGDLIQAINNNDPQIPCKLTLLIKTSVPNPDGLQSFVMFQSWW